MSLNAIGNTSDPVVVTNRSESSESAGCAENPVESAEATDSFDRWMQKASEEDDSVPSEAAPEKAASEVRAEPKEEVPEEAEEESLPWITDILSLIDFNAGAPAAAAEPPAATVYLPSSEMKTAETSETPAADAVAILETHASSSSAPGARPILESEKGAASASEAPADALPQTVTAVSQERKSDAPVEMAEAVNEKSGSRHADFPKNVSPTSEKTSTRELPAVNRVDGFSDRSPPSVRPPVQTTQDSDIGLRPVVGLSPAVAEIRDPVSAGASRGVADASKIAAASSSLAELRSVTTQVREALGPVLRENKNEVRLHLTPPEWGEVDVKVRFDREEIHIDFTAQHGFVEEALERGMTQLRHSFQSEGLSLGQVHVGVGGDANARGQGHESENFSERGNAPVLKKVLPAGTPAKRENSLLDMTA